MRMPKSRAYNFYRKGKELPMSKKLVAYFSATGTTKRAAEKLAQKTGADLYEIKPAEPYSSADLNWNDKGSRSSKEMNDLRSRPALADTNAPIADHDVIYLGFPVWWYVAPRIINTFLEAYDFSGKTIVVWVTSGGSGLGRTVPELETCVSDATFIAGGRITGSASIDDIANKI